MRHTPRQYAEAFLLAMKEKPQAKKQAIGRLLYLMRKNGDSQRLGSILREIEKQHFKKSGAKKVVLESAAPVSSAVKKEIGAILGKNIFMEEKINPRILGGIKILVNGETLIDASAKYRLNRIFGKNN